MKPRILLCVVAVLVSCRAEVPEETVNLAQAIPGIPLPPAATVTGRAGSADALQLSFRSEWSEEDLIGYYRGIFTKEPWKLVSDVRDSDGAAVLYAERDGPPIWVRIHKAAGASGVAVEISGAVTGAATNPEADSATADSASAPSAGD